MNERVVVDGNWVFAAGVTAGIDGALRLAAELRGDAAAQAIQLHMAYAPEPPLSSGTPETTPPAILEQARRSVRDIGGAARGNCSACCRKPRHRRSQNRCGLRTSPSDDEYHATRGGLAGNEG